MTGNILDAAADAARGLADNAVEAVAPRAMAAVLGATHSLVSPAFGAVAAVSAIPGVFTPQEDIGSRFTNSYASISNTILPIFHEYAAAHPVSTSLGAMAPAALLFTVGMKLSGRQERLDLRDPAFDTVSSQINAVILPAFYSLAGSAISVATTLASAVGGGRSH